MFLTIQLITLLFKGQIFVLLQLIKLKLLPALYLLTNTTNVYAVVIASSTS